MTNERDSLFYFASKLEILYSIYDPWMRERFDRHLRARLDDATLEAVCSMLLGES